MRSQTTSFCIEPFLDDNGNVILVADCVCDPTCEICGYYGEAVSGPQDCFTCPTGFVHTELFDDGSGTCTVSDGSGTTDPVETLSPTSVTDAPTEPNTSTGGSTATSSNGICMMVYQMADNDLETFLQADLSEITKSSFTQSLSTTTWIYHDGLDSGDPYYTGDTLVDVYNSDGTVLTESFTSGRYLNWDHDLGKMVVNTTFSSELNSDSSAVLQAFIAYALTDCIAQGKSEFFLVLSSHGAGFEGFGGDIDNVRRLRRKLTQATASIVSAIQGALSSVSGAPSQLDVLGFDACLMQAMDALDDFAGITRYYLASEAVEPGHGWAYNELSATNSAKDLAVDIVNTFVSSLHNDVGHDTPKTLAVVDTTLFAAFRDAWDAMCSEMADILSSGSDADFHALLLRARGNTLSFEGYLDSSSTQVNSAMDIGDFFVQLFQICDPDESSQLYLLIMNAYDAYNAMFVAAGLGPGTPLGTGMHITWLSKQEYVNYQDIYQEILFPATGSFPLMGSPNYGRFLTLYYNTSTPVDNVGTSVCGISAGVSNVDSPSDLLIDPGLYQVDGTTKELRSQITRSVDFVSVLYGIDVTHLLQDQSVRRRLNEASRRQQARQLEVGEGGTIRRLPSFARRHTAMSWRHRRTGETSSGRRLQQDAASGGTEDYFLIYGGDVPVAYNGPNVTASWDSTFIWIESGEDLEPVYASDGGGGLKSIPVCYFDQSHPVTSDQIANVATVDDAIAGLGCQQGFLSFSVAEDSDSIINLYVYKESTGALSEVILGAGRSIVPILYVLFAVGDEFATELLGGFSSIVIPWTPETDVAVYIISDSENLEIFEADTAFLQIYAYDEDLQVEDVAFLPYSFDDNSDGTEPPSDNEDPGDNPPTDTNGDVPDESSSTGTSISLGIGITTLILICSTTIHAVCSLR